MSKVRILRPQGSYDQLPLYSGKVSAGFPGVVDEHMEGKLSLNELLINDPDVTFFAQVEGDSMIEAGIFPNDFLVVDRSLSATDGDVVVALLNNEFTVKRLRTDGALRLQADNKEYPDIMITGDVELVIWGVVRGVVRTLK